MKENTCLSTMMLNSSRISFLSMAALALAIFVTPDFARSTDMFMVTDSSGNVKFSAGDNGTIRLNSNILPATVPTWSLLYGSSDNNQSGLAFDSYGSPVGEETNVVFGGGGLFRFARGVQASPTAVQIGDRLGFFVFGGYDGTNFLSSAGLTVKVDGTVSAGSVPSKIVFETLSSGYPRLERMIISSNGYVAIGGDLGDGIPTPSMPFQVGNAYVTAGGVWTNASSREYKENINTLTTEEANKALDGLSPVKYNYKTDKEDRHVGFIAEDVPDLVATKDRKGLSPMDIAAVLTKVVQEQKNTISGQTNMINEQMHMIADQNNMISALSKRLDTMQKEINRVKGMNIMGSIGASIK